MKKRPILFSGPMVQAILEGRKAQTRRVMKIQPVVIDGVLMHHERGSIWESGRPYKCPYGVPGDRLWVREEMWRWGKWAANGHTKTGRRKWKFVPVGTGIRYRENKPTPDGMAKRDGECGWVYRHARFMPHALSRLTLEITAVRVQRLQEISEEDAIAEGLTEWEGNRKQPNLRAWRADDKHCNFCDPRRAFRDLWDSINEKRGFGWDANPWVWAITFKQVSA